MNLSFEAPFTGHIAVSAALQAIGACLLGYLSMMNGGIFDLENGKHETDCKTNIN